MLQNNQSKFNKNELENYIANTMERWDIPGLSIAVVKDGETVLCKGYGTCEAGKDRPVNEDTLFAIANTSASFTAAALAILVGEGKLDWNDLMVDLLPEFRTASSDVTHQATLVDILTHRTGLQADLVACLPNPDLSRAELLKRLRYVKPAHGFRSRKGFSFLTTVAAGEIIPALTGISWADFVNERLFKPIGMTSSITGPDLIGNNPNVATPHANEGGIMTAIPRAQNSNIGPANSMYSSAADMAKWLNFQLNTGKLGDRTLIPEAQIKEMRTGYIPYTAPFPEISQHFIHQGLGILISDSSSGGLKMYSGGGDTEGMESYHAFVPELNLGIAVMINSTKVLPQPLVAWIIDRYTGAPEKDWVNDSVAFYEEEMAGFLPGLDKSREAITDPLKKATLPLDAYAGLYQSPLLGQMKVEVKDNDLSFTLGKTYQGILHHANYDCFFIQTKTPYLGRFLFSGPLQFQLDKTGELCSLLAADTEFQKVGRSV